jgi:hypothetical protein
MKTSVVLLTDIFPKSINLFEGLRW